MQVCLCLTKALEDSRFIIFQIKKEPYGCYKYFANGVLFKQMVNHSDCAIGLSVLLY
jgi:hypothetical protein